MTEIIIKKRSGKELTRDELCFALTEFVRKRLPDYQMSALLMAIFFKGMSSVETAHLTELMIASGNIIDLDTYTYLYVDKHSTGGVGDGTSLVIAPLVAACGVRVPMISGRALGHTGGTLDKLDAIPNYSTALDIEQFIALVTTQGYGMSGQSSQVAPADKYLYALRDVTGTVESIPLITSSILSKKVAEGTDALVVDIKCGYGAFARTLDFAEHLAHSLKDTAQQLGKEIVAIITAMNQPLGCMIGNFLEIEQAAYILGGYSSPEYPKHLISDYIDISIYIAATMLVLAKRVDTLSSAQQLITAAMTNGSAWEYFCNNVVAQGGNLEKLRGMFGHFRAPIRYDITAKQDGYISIVNAYYFGRASAILGAGRIVVDSSVYPDVGIQLHKKGGERVSHGDIICTLFGRDTQTVDCAARLISENGVCYSDASPAADSLIIKRV